MDGLGINLPVAAVAVVRIVKGISIKDALVETIIVEVVGIVTVIGTVGHIFVIVVAEAGKKGIRPVVPKIQASKVEEVVLIVH